MSWRQSVSAAADKILDTLRDKVKVDEEAIEAAQFVAWQDIIVGMRTGKFAYLGDMYAPTDKDIGALVKMFNILYISATRYRNADWAMEGYEEYHLDRTLEIENERKTLLARGAKPEKIDAAIESPLVFEDWFINNYRRGWLWLIKGKISDIIARSQTAFEEREKTKVTSSAYGALQPLPMGDGRRPLSTMRGPAVQLDEVIEADKDKDE